MRIGILGAPGSGKSEFAQALAKGLGWTNCVIDDYLEDLRRETGLEYGGFGSHIDDIQVVFKRREWELALRDADTITVGTVLDSAVHCFVRTDEAARTRKEIGLQAERLRTIAGTFGLLYTDTWEYDYAFFLRYKGESRHSVMIDAGLVELIATYRAPVFHFNPEVPDDEKAATAASAITTLEAEQLPPTPERGVRSGSESGGEVGDSSASVPDVSESGRTPDDS